MGDYRPPARAKLIIGFLSGLTELVGQVRKELKNKFGPEEEVLESIPFTWTNFYEKEIGTNPVRTFVSYENTFPREEIVEIKRYTNELELTISNNGLRPVNIDPGYMTLGQFFLATTKDQRQRVYMGNGIFVEPSLYFKDGEFHTFDWTYRDYCSRQYLDYFLRARSKLAYQLKHDRPYSKRNGAF